MTALPEHGVQTGGDPKDPEVKKKRDYVRNVCGIYFCFYIIFVVKLCYNTNISPLRNIKKIYVCLFACLLYA